MEMMHKGYKSKHGFHVANKDWEKFNFEFEKFIHYRKDLIHSEWGEKLKEKIMGIRHTAPFQDLMKQFHDQCKTESGLELKASFEDFLAAIVKNV